MTSSRGLALDRLRKLSNKTMGDGWLSLILEDVTVEDLVSALKTLGAEEVTVHERDPITFHAGEPAIHVDPGRYVVWPLPDKEET